MPAEQVPNRPDDLIFNEIGGFFILNMILNSFWFTFFFHKTTGGYAMAQIVIFAMLATAIYPAMKAVEAADNGELNDWMVLWGLRGGMSVYSGWLTVASILSFSIMLEDAGMTDDNGWDEESWTIGMLWIAFLVFTLTTYLNNDPVYGAVLVWASFGIRSENELGSDAIESTLNIIMALMSAFDLYVAFG